MLNALILTLLQQLSVTVHRTPHILNDLRHNIVHNIYVRAVHCWQSERKLYEFWFVLIGKGFVLRLKNEDIHVPLNSM